MDDAEFWSADRRYGLLMSGDLVEELFARCENAGSVETGSILVGHYRCRNSLAVVTDLPETPSDSTAGPAYFDRGTRGLKGVLKRLWRSERYYLGEWHYHPGATSDASRCDHIQMAAVSSSDRYMCPEPILVIVGGSSPCFRLAAQVYPDGRHVPLSPS